MKIKVRQHYSKVAKAIELHSRGLTVSFVLEEENGRLAEPSNRLYQRIPFIFSMRITYNVSIAGLPTSPLYLRKPEYKRAVEKILEDAERQIKLRGVTSPKYEAGIRTSLTQLKRELELDSTIPGYGKAIISFFRDKGIEFEPAETQRGYAWRTTLRDLEMFKLEIRNMRF